jgi:hypothetical protein
MAVSLTRVETDHWWCVVLEADAVHLAGVAERVGRHAVVRGRICEVVEARVADEDLVGAAADDLHDARIRCCALDRFGRAARQPIVEVRDRIVLQVDVAIRRIRLGRLEPLAAAPVEAKLEGGVAGARRGRRAHHVERIVCRDPDVLGLVRGDADDAAAEVAGEEALLLRERHVVGRPRTGGAENDAAPAAARIGRSPGIGRAARRRLSGIRSVSGRRAAPATPTTGGRAAAAAASPTASRRSRRRPAAARAPETDRRHQRNPVQQPAG